MEKYDLMGMVLSSSVLTGVAGWFVGRRKEDIEVALKYQEFYEKHIKDAGFDFIEFNVKEIKVNDLL